MVGRYCACEILIANPIDWLYAACLEYFIFFSIDSSEARKQYWWILSVNHANNNLCTWQNAYTDSDCPCGIFKLFLRIVPKKYLLLLDQTILIHFRSSIDRPLNLPQYPGRKYIINNWRLMKKKLFWMKWCLFYFYLTFVYNCYVPTYQRFWRQRLLLKYQNVI